MTFFINKVHKIYLTTQCGRIVSRAGLRLKVIKGLAKLKKQHTSA
jgi:hypothetical protein